MVEYQFPRITRTIAVILILHAIFFILSMFIPDIIHIYLGLYWADLPVLNLTLIYRLFTYPFVVVMHDVIGLLFLALFMWWVGSGLERSWGTKRFIIFYLVTISISGLLCLPIIHLTGLHGGFITGTIGLTFSIIAVYAFLTPNTPFYVFGIFPIKVKWLLFISLLFTFIVPIPSFILYHLIIQLITALVAVAFVFFTQPLPIWVVPLLGDFKKGIRRMVSSIQYKQRRKKFTYYRHPFMDEETSEYHTEEKDDDSWTQKEVNRILDKISKEGLQSLTKEEKQFLDIVSDNMRKNNMDN